MNPDRLMYKINLNFLKLALIAIFTKRHLGSDYIASYRAAKIKFLKPGRQSVPGSAKGTFLFR
jgi:hypothetical protein